MQENNTIDHEYAVAQANQGQGLSLGNADIFHLADRADKSVDAINTITKAALRLTTPLDWVNIGGKPYLQETGASKIATLMRVNRRVLPPTKQYDPDGSGHYTYSTMGEFEFAGMSITAFGMRSTRDEFFIGSASATMKDKDGNIVPKPQKKPQDVDERDVMQAAYSNCVNRGIKELIPGLRNISMEQLAAAGIDTSKVSGYGFNSAAPAEMSSEAKDQRADIERMLKEMCGEEKWIKGLQKITAWTTKDGKEMKGKTSVNAITENAMPVVYGKVKAEYEKWKATKGTPPQNPSQTYAGLTGEFPSDAAPPAQPYSEDEHLPWEVPPEPDGEAE